jgi:vacuolar-type H+-ATPase subunit I/STV1
LHFADRLTSDIKRGVVDLDYEDTKERLTQLIDELYDKGEMEYVKTVGERFFSDRYIYCLDLLEHVKEKNAQYLTDRGRSATESVWSRITATPDQYLEILDSEENKPVFAMYSETTDILQALESLSNSQLFELTRWMGSRVTSTTEKPAVQEEHERALQIAELLDREYGSRFSVRAGHMKQVSRVLRNQKTDYDPEYVAKIHRRFSRL